MAKGKYTKWLEPDGLLLLEAWARNGLTDEQIAQNMDVGVRTLYEYKQKYPQISQSLKKGKEVVDIQVENALLRRALGYSYIEETRERIVEKGQRERHKDASTEMELTETEWNLAVSYFNGACCYCGKYNSKPTKDHLKPLKSGGTFTVDNIVPCCLSCNSSKKDNEWLSWFQRQDFYEAKRAEKIADYLNFITELQLVNVNKDDDLLLTKQVTKQVIPDVTAQIFWLKNRKPDVWRDKKDVEHSGEINNPYAGLTTEELRKLIDDG